MIKRIISGVLVTGILATGMTALACGCGEKYRTYEFNSNGKGQHEVAFSCSYIYCDDPFTIVGFKDCVPYEDHYDPIEDVTYYKCDLCGGDVPSEYVK